jgi:hypothetical protein
MGTMNQRNSMDKLESRRMSNAAMDTQMSPSLNRLGGTTMRESIVVPHNLDEENVRVFASHRDNKVNTQEVDIEIISSENSGNKMNF